MGPGTGDEDIDLPRAAEDLAARRARISHTALRAVLYLGFLAYVPSAWLCVRTGAFAILALDTLVYLAIVVAWRIPAARYQLRGAILVGLFYLLGTALSLDLGATGAGPLWLLATPVTAAIFFDRRLTLFVLGGTAATTVLILVLLMAVPLDWTDPATPLGIWLMMTGNVAVAGAVLTLGVTSLISGLRSSAERAERFGVALAEQHTRLVAANERLRCEMEERQNAEEQLRQSEKLSAVGTLAGGIAHDINNLLTPILASAELLRNEESPGSERAELLDRMLDGARGGKDLVRRILAFSRPSAEDRVPLDSQAVFGDAARLLRATLPAGVDVVLRSEESVGAVLLTPAEANQLVLNLGINAHHAMPQGGTLTILLDELEAFTDAPDSMRDLAITRFVRLTVHDTGLGMDEETRRRAFEPFFTTRGTGTGIGLATVHGIVTSTGGWIDCESAPGVGTTMRLHLPRVDPPALAPPASPARPLARGAGQHVLIVDDEDNVRTVAARVLERAGYRATMVANAEESLRLLTRPDSGVELVLTDLKMPGLTGLELAASLRTLVPDTPIILMSGLVDDDLRSRATAVGIRAVVTKPFEIHPLLEVVAAALESGGTPIMPSTPQSFPLGRSVADFTADSAAKSAHA